MSNAKDDFIDRPVVMVGLMGAGKTSVGRALARRLGIPFVDSDKEIEAAAGCSVVDIFSIDFYLGAFQCVRIETTKGRWGNCSTRTSYCQH